MDGLKIGLIFAMEKEMERVSGRFSDFGVKCVLSGIGKVNAAACAQRLILQYHPHCIVSVGCAGSFANGVEVGDIVVGEETAYHDFFCGDGVGKVPDMPLRFAADPSLLKLASESSPNAKKGLICTGDQFYVNELEDERQRRLYPDALAVDMESAAIAQVCFMNGVPFIAVRAISDVHNDGRQAEHYSDFWESRADETFGGICEIIKSML